MNTCWCQTVSLDPILGGYMTFENTESLRDLFNVVTYWSTAAGFGLAIPVVSFVVAVFWWLRCQPLWKADEKKSRNTGSWDPRINWVWLT